MEALARMGGLLFAMFVKYIFEKRKTCVSDIGGASVDKWNKGQSMKK